MSSERKGYNMQSRPKIPKWMLAGVILQFLIGASLLAGVVYIVAHFALKYW